MNIFFISRKENNLPFRKFQFVFSCHLEEEAEHKIVLNSEENDGNHGKYTTNPTFFVTFFNVNGHTY